MTKHLSAAHRKAISEGLKRHYHSHSKKKWNKYKGYKIAGVTYDGIRVLKPKTKSKSFTAKGIRKAIAFAMGNYPKVKRVKRHSFGMQTSV